ncbi:hypothetical protein AAFF_G00204650 [Aldrovandia affinis]|uniref:Ig-like domain-containing protein n=1 Tax=Aldrovandia affinis TaxID=143900 RepID=A0AAD7RHT4_9TELE|nr:hypothetical protein AAFF_G00204650 [Aldrovandia affinis]
MSPCPRCCAMNVKDSELVWFSLTVLLILLQGNSGQITVTQTPSVVVSALNQNVTLDCQFSHTPDQKVTGVILYWYHRWPGREDQYIYPHVPTKYQNRIMVLDSNRTNKDKSIVLLGVGWEDRYKYHCMLSYDRGDDANRMRGAGVLLLLHDSMTFDLAPWTPSSLLCSVEVSPHPELRLSMLEDGVEGPSVQNDTHALHSTLSLLIPLYNDRKYECRLNWSSEIILSQTYFIPSALPEPIFLYSAILLIPFIILLIILTGVLVKCRLR